MNNPNFKHSIEITKEVFELLKGNDEKTWRDFANNELAEWTTYFAKGHRIMALHNFVSNVTQYYMQDINA
tara:strand:- start:260 stop:469 length:210 start_codon:yes stop_codon:yes gene_type:complete